MGGAGIHGLIVIGVWKLIAVPALQEREEKRGKHRDAGNGLVTGQPLAHCRSHEPRDLGVGIHGHALIGVPDGRIPEALQHDVAVGGEVDGTGMLRRGQARNRVIGHIVPRDAANRRIARAFVDGLMAHQRARPGDAAVGRVQDADLRFLVGVDGLDHLHADPLPGRAAIAEIVLDHPLNEALAHDGRGIIPAGRALHALGDIGRRARRDAVHHGVRTAGVRHHPVVQPAVVQQCDELQQAAAETFAVVPQVVAVEQRDFAAWATHPLAQDGRHCCVDRAAWFALPRRRDISRQIRKTQIKTIPGIEIVTGLRHGEGDYARRGIGSERDQTCQARLIRDDSLDRRDFGVASRPGGRDGLQRVRTALRREAGYQFHRVGPGVASGQHPAVVSRFDEPMEVPGLMRAMEEAEPQMEHHERGRHG